MTADKGVYILTICLLACIRSALTTLDTVWLTDVTAISQTDKRKLSATDLPKELEFHLRWGSETRTLHLRRNHNINPHADFYFARKVKDGKSVLVKSQNMETEDVAYYQDQNNGAFMTVRCVKVTNKQCDRMINGNIRIGDSWYYLRPAGNDVKSRNLLEVPGHLDKLYVLQDQSITQRETSAEWDGASNLTKEEVGKEFKALFQRFQRQDKSQRQSKNEYHVKVAVLIDSGLWDFYSSMVIQSHELEKRRKVRQNIRESFSHIVNGVNELYKGIEDNSISINIILADFIVFKNNAFPHKASKVVKVDNIKHIDADKYLTDAKEWDKEYGVKNVPVFDFGMLFTRYKMFFDTPDDEGVHGHTFSSGVCQVGKRIAVIKAGGLFSTVLLAAHELGHSLGADHDGVLSAKDCKASDQFIMSASVPPLNKTSSSRNPWSFSSCSVRSFKKVLKDKKCVTVPGRLYDIQEYMDYVQHEPGVVYNTTEQCRLIIGRKSTVCKTHEEDVCDKMRCTNPATGKCPRKYHGAARGTECGQNHWCIEARCVPKI